MTRLLGWLMVGGLLLGYGSSADAQVNVQFGRNGTPSVSFGQQPGYYNQQPGYYNQQPGNFVQQPGYYNQQPRYYSQQPAYGQQYTGSYPQPGYYTQPARPAYSSGYSGYAPGYGTTTYPTQYRPQSYYYNNGGYAPSTQPSYGAGTTGVMINGRSY